MAPNGAPPTANAAKFLLTRLVPIVVVTQCVFSFIAFSAIRSGWVSLATVAIAATIIVILTMSGAVLFVGRQLRRGEQDRERRAEEMRLSHERFVLAVEGSSDGLWDWHIQTNQVYFSPRYKAMLGYEDADITNDFSGWERLIHPEDLPIAKKRVGDYHDGRIPVYELEHRLLQKNGTYRWILARGTLLRDAQGRPLRMSGSHADIDERKNIEAALRESEQRFRQVTENIREVIWLSDVAKHEIIYISPGYELIWGRSCQSLYDSPRTWVSALHPEDRDRVLTAATTKQAGGDYDEIYRVVRPDGQVRWIRDRAFPVRDENGAVYRIAGLAEDVTERRRLDEELTAARDQALASNRAKTEFLANMSHEMRTPLNAIQGMCELMTAQTLPEPHASRAKLAHDAVQILTATIDDLLDLSKLDAGRMILDPFAVDVRGLCDNLIVMAGAQAFAKGVALTFDLAGGVPPFLRADPLRLRQVVSNLLNNAIKFTEKGAVTLEVGAEPRGENEVLLSVAVRDTGIGIAPNIQGRLFQPFPQADASTTRRYGGTGLGLAICRRLVEAMGGEIGLKSSPGEGSRFWFRVPLRIEEHAAPAQASPAAVPGLPRLRVLVVEDNEPNRRIALEMLAHLGVTAETAENGALGLEKMTLSAYDLVFMDCSMPVLDGYEAAKRWRKREASGARLPIVAMTAHAAPGDKEKCLAAGMDDHLTKPVRLRDLVASLSRWGSPVDPAVHARAAALVGEAAPRWKNDYLKDARLLLLELRTAEGAGFERAAHTLKGSSSSFGALRLSALCARIEAAGRAEPEQLAEAERELELVAASLV